MNRRDFLATGGAIGVVALAGCPETSESGPGTGDDSGPDDTGTPEPSYELDFSLVDDTLDLSDLPASELDTYDSIRDDDFLELEATVYEELGGEQEEVEDYELDIQIGDETVEPEQEEDSVYRIACTELETGENDVTVTVEVDGETLEQSATVTKQTPDAHLIEAYVDGDHITQYSSPYEFDTQETDSEEIAERRLEEHPVWEDALEYVDEDEIQEIAQNGTKKELLVYTEERTAEYIWDEGIEGASANAQQQAATQQEMIQEHTDYGLTDVYGNGFNNPADTTTDQSGNHGTKAFYIDGDWFHQEPVPGDTAHVDNLDQIQMVSGRQQDFVSVLGEFEEGEMETVRFSNKMSRMSSFYSSQAIPGSIVSSNDMRVSDPYGSTGLEMIRDNADRKNVMAPVEAAADHHIDTGQRAVVLGTPDEPVILSTNDRELYNRIEEDPDFQDAETILGEALN